EIRRKALSVQTDIFRQFDQSRVVRGISRLQVIGLLNRKDHGVLEVGALSARGDHGAASRVSGTPRNTFRPEIEIEPGARHRALYGSPDALNLFAHLGRHGHGAVRRQAAQKLLDLDTGRQSAPNALPYRPKRPTPTAHGIVEIEQ